jgi:hypothetical protein
VTHGSHIQIWRTPNHLLREFAPFTLHRTYTGHHDDVLSIQWSPDSTYVFFGGSFRYRMMRLVDTQMLHHHIEGHDGSSLYPGPNRRVPTENFCRTPRRCFECLFLSRWQHSEFHTFSFQLLFLMAFFRFILLAKMGPSSPGKRKKLRMTKIRTKNRSRRLRMALCEMSSIG